MAQWMNPGQPAGSFLSKETDGQNLFKNIVSLRPELSPAYERYLSQAHCEETPDGLVISVPTTFHANGIQPFLGVIEQTFNKAILSIQIRRPKTPESAPARAPQLQVPLSLTARRSEGAAALDAEKQSRQVPPTLISSPVFAEAIEITKRWAHALNGGQRSQCLWVYGESGSGKSWLLKQLNTLVHLEKKLIFVDVMSFFHEWRRSMETKTQMSFIRKYRKESHLLVLENIDELQGKPGTQQELLFTVGAILDRGGSVAVSSHLSPLALQELIEPALFSRLHSGHSIEMPTPDRAFKESLWRHLLTQHALGDAQIDLVLLERIFAIPANTARKVHSLFINVISRLSFKSSLDMSDVNELTQKHSGQISHAGISGQASPSEIMDRVAKVCGLGVGAIQGRIRRADVCLARRFVCLALSRHLGLTNSVIANLIEKDPSTVSHSLRTIEEEIESTRRIAQQWNYICSQLGIAATVNT